MTNPPNPYIGPRPFEPGEILYGRNRETRQLKALLTAERIVLLHSPSGAGKTSLIQAGLIPVLKEDQFFVFPIIRVSLQSSENLLTQEWTENPYNRYKLSTLISLEKALPDHLRMPFNELINIDLDTYLKYYRTKDEGKPISEVLIFDQFEEILSASPTDYDEKMSFFLQLGTALRNPNRWALFAMREDYVAALSPYLRPIPNRLNCTYRLDLLGTDDARQAIQAPAKSVGVDFTDNAVEKLVNDLRSIQVQQVDGAVEIELGLVIEPVQLQVVCNRLWERKKKNQNVINIDDIDSAGDVDQSLAEYYENSLREVVNKTGVKERCIREWFANKLIRSGGIRGQVPMGKTESDGLSNTAVDSLIATHLIRGEKHAGVTWFELVHDRLIEPIQRNNANWFKINLSLVQVQAALWEAQGRPERLLIKDNELDKALQWAIENQEDVTPIEKQFLFECQRIVQHEQEIQELKLHEEALKEKHRKEKENRDKRIIIGLVIGLIITIGLAVTAYIQRQEMQTQKQKALDRLLLARIGLMDLRESKMQIPRLALSIEAFRRLNDAEAYQAIWSSTNAFGSENVRIKTSHSVKSICFSNDDQLLISEDSNHTIQIWDTTTGNELVKIDPSLNLTSRKDTKEKVICSPSGKIVSIEESDKESKIITRNDQTGAILSFSLLDDLITDFTVSSNGKFIVSGSKGGKITLWDAITGQRIDQILDDNWINSIVINPQGTQIASANIDGDIILWNFISHTTSRIHTQTTQLILAYSPDGKWLVTGGNNGSVTFWDSITGKELKAIFMREGITSLAYSPKGDLLYTTSQDGDYKIWNTSTQPLSEVVGGIYYGPIHDVHFSLDGEFIIQGGMSGYTQVYGLGKMDKMGKATAIYSTATLFGEGQVVQNIFSPSGRKFASVINTGEIMISPVKTNILNHDLKVWDIKFNTTSSLIVTSSMDATAKVWDIKTGQKLLELSHDDQVNRATFNPIGNLIVTASSDDTAKVWRVIDGQETLRIVHKGKVADVQFSPNGKLVGSAGWDGIAQIWDVKS